MRPVRPHACLQGTVEDFAIGPYESRMMSAATAEQSKSTSRGRRPVSTRIDISAESAAIIGLKPRKRSRDAGGDEEGGQRSDEEVLVQGAETGHAASLSLMHHPSETIAHRL